MKAGKVVAWLKKPGDSIRQREALLEVDTEKANVEVESPVDGVLAEIRTQEGTTATVGEVIAVVSVDHHVVGELEWPLFLPTSRTC